MKPQWISNTFIGPFWMGTPKQIEETKESIDKEISIYCEDENNGDRG